MQDDLFPEYSKNSIKLFPFIFNFSVMFCLLRLLSYSIPGFLRDCIDKSRTQLDDIFLNPRQYLQIKKNAESFELKRFGEVSFSWVISDGVLLYLACKCYYLVKCYHSCQCYSYRCDWMQRVWCGVAFGL